MSSKPLRVCDECYRALSTKSGDGRHISTGKNESKLCSMPIRLPYPANTAISGERLNSDSDESEDSDDDEETERNGQTEVGIFGRVAYMNGDDDE